MHDALDDNLTPLLGEFAWHSVTVDPTIDDVSTAHYKVLDATLKKHGVTYSPELRILEVASYAHTTGYQLHHNLGVLVELFDISASTLRLGCRIAQEKGLPVYGTGRTMGDFHELPYENGQFDVVYICSALHHTWRWQRVLSEMIRVLAPEGILFLENEPTRRDFCFGKFRVNRPAKFTPFEQKLEQLGIIRTIAEPFLGSRPETLFGMVENQTMPLAAILESIEAQCSALEIIIQPEMCIGAFEREILDRRNMGAVGLAGWLTSRLTELIEQARTTFSEIDRGLGFSLPSKQEIRTVCERAASTVSRLPSNESSWEFRKGISQLFGAPLKMTARKKGLRRTPARGRINGDFPQIDGVTIAFPPAVARLLDPKDALLPDLQTASEAVLERLFPPSDWIVGVSGNNVRELRARLTQPRILVPVPKPGSLVVLIRMYVIFSGRPYKVTVCNDNRELSSFGVFQTESILLSNKLLCTPGKEQAVLSLKAVSFDGAQLPADSFRILYLGAFIL